MTRGIERKMPIGLEVCFTPEDLRLKKWYQDDSRATVRGGIIPIVTWRHFPNKKWYVIGDDDTMFSPLALAQLLSSYNHEEEIYIGTRSEKEGQRKDLGYVNHQGYTPSSYLIYLLLPMLVWISGGIWVLAGVVLC